jgi:hypothetical protein
LTGGLGEIPEPTVKVRMREIQQCNWCSNFINLIGLVGDALVAYFSFCTPKTLHKVSGGVKDVNRTIDATRN